MTLAPKRRLAIGISVLAVALVGAGASSACDGGGTQTVRAAQFAAWHSDHRLGWWGLGFVRATAAYLGTTPQQLVADLKSGQTLAQVAPSGTSPAGLADAWLAAAKSRLDAAVAAGKLTSAQESDILARLAPKLTAWANAVWTKSWTRDHDGR